MAESETDRNENAEQIIDGILQDAREEAERLRQEARSEVEDRRMLLDGRVRRVKDDAAAEAKKREEEIRRRSEAEISRAKRGNELSRRQEVVSAVERRARERVIEMGRRQSDDYRRALFGWTAEGALGLEGAELQVAPASGEEKLLDGVLPEAQREVARVSGREVTLRRAPRTHAGAAGVVVSDLEGRTLYDNGIDARLARHGTEIRRLVFDLMFVAEESGDDR